MELPKFDTSQYHWATADDLRVKDLKTIQSNHNLTSSCRQLLDHVPKVLIQTSTKTYRDLKGQAGCFLGRLFQCLSTLTGKNFFPMSHLSPASSGLKPLASAPELRQVLVAMAWAWRKGNPRGKIALWASTGWDSSSEAGTGFAGAHRGGWYGGGAA